MQRKTHIITAFSLTVLLGSCGGNGGSSPGVVKVTVANNSGSTVFFAYQDGSGTWQVLAPSVSGYKYIYQFNVSDSSGKYGVVVYCTSNLKGFLFHGLITERNDLYVNCGAPTFTLTGSFLLNGNQISYDAFAHWGPQYNSPNQSGTYSMNVREGTHDIIALLEDGQSDNNSLDVSNVAHVVIQRNVTVSGNTNNDIEFAGSPASDMTNYNWSCGNSNVPSNPRVSFLSEGGTTIFNIGGSTYKPIIPSSLLVTGDFWNFSATETSGSATTTYQEFHAQPGNYTCQGFPSHLPQGASFHDVDVGQSFQRISISWNSYTSGLNNHSIKVYKLNEYMKGGTYYWYMHWTIGWLGSASPYSYTFPNLSGLSGWNDSWYPSEATQTGRGDWNVYTSNKSTADLLNLYFEGKAIDGMEYVNAQYSN